MNINQPEICTCKRIISGGGSWTPLDLSPDHFFIASESIFTDDAGTVPATVEDAHVAVQKDIITGNKIYQTVDAARPLLKLTGLNGKPTLSYPFNTSELPADSGVFTMNGNSVITLFGVLSQDARPSGDVFEFFTDGSNSLRCLLSLDDLRIITETENVIRIDSQSGTSAFGIGFHACIFIFTGTHMSMIIDGTVVVNNEAYASTPSAATYSRFVIGSLMTAGWSGSCAEFGIVKRVITQEEIDAYNAYISSRYGL